MLNDEGDFGDFELLHVTDDHIDNLSNDSQNTCKDLTVNVKIFTHNDNNTRQDLNEVLIHNCAEVLMNHPGQFSEILDQSSSNEDNSTTTLDETDRNNFIDTGEINDCKKFVGIYIEKHNKIIKTIQWVLQNKNKKKKESVNVDKIPKSEREMVGKGIFGKEEN